MRKKIAETETAMDLGFAAETKYKGKMIRGF